MLLIKNHDKIAILTITTLLRIILATTRVQSDLSLNPLVDIIDSLLILMLFKFGKTLYKLFFFKLNAKIVFWWITKHEMLQASPDARSTQTHTTSSSMSSLGVMDNKMEMGVLPPIKETDETTRDMMQALELERKNSGSMKPVEEEQESSDTDSFDKLIDIEIDADI